MLFTLTPSEPKSPAAASGHDAPTIRGHVFVMLQLWTSKFSKRARNAATGLDGVLSS